MNVLQFSKCFVSTMGKEERWRQICVRGGKAVPTVPTATGGPK